MTTPRVLLCRFVEGSRTIRAYKYDRCKKGVLDETDEDISTANPDLNERGNRRDSVRSLLFQISVHTTINFQKPGYLPQCRATRDPGALQAARPQTFLSTHERIRQMKLLPQEIKRLRANALLVKKVSPDTKLEVTKRDLSAWTKDVLITLQTKKQVKHMMLVCVETDKEEG